MLSGLLLMVLTPNFARPVAAANRFWIASALGNFNVDANWSNSSGGPPSSAPTAADIAIFDGGGSGNCALSANASVQGMQINPTYLGTMDQATGTALNVGGSGYVQNGASGFSFHVGGTATFGFNSFQVSGGTFNAGDGTIVFNDVNIILTGGQFIAPGSPRTMTFAQGGSNLFNRTDPAVFQPNGGTVVISGNSQVSFNVNGLGTAGTIAFKNLTINATTGIIIDNEDTLQVTGALTLTDGFASGGTIQADDAVSIAGTFDGGGTTLLIVGPARTVTIPTGMSGTFLSTTLNSLGSTLNSNGPGALRMARLNLQSGTIESGASDWTINSSYQQSGGLFTGGAGSLIFNIASTLTLTAGVFNGPNTIDFRDVNITLTGGQFVAPSGTMTFSQGGSNQFNRNDPAVFQPNGGTVLIAGDAQLGWHINGGAPGTDNLTNLTVNTTSPVGGDTGDTLRVTGTLSLVNGFVTGNTLLAEGNVAVAAGFDGGNSALTFAGGANQTFTNSGGVIPTGTWTVNKPAGFLTLASDLSLQSTQQLNITSGIFSQGVSFNLTAGPIAIAAAGRLSNQGSGDLTLRGDISNAGIISLNGGGGSCNDPDSILIRSLPDGTQRTWSGAGSFFLSDVDVKDQAAANPPVITIFNGTDSGNNTNFNFVAGCNPTAASARISGKITTPDGLPVSGAVIVLSGSQTRKTITDANGDYQFDEVGTGGFYTVMPSRVNYSFSPGARSFSQLGESSEAVFTALPTGAEANPLDTPEYFVRQHYLDFLGREADESGFNFWSEQITSCGSDFACAERRRINVSAAYFLSIEFQQTGGLVDGLYRTSYGRRPLYVEFMPDTAGIAQDVVVGRGEWQQQLSANKAAFIEAFVQRTSFRSVYDNLTDGAYFDKLIANTGVNYSQSERAALVNGLTGGTLTRAAVLRQVAENERFMSAKFNEAFVMMQYFGYLRRDPDESGYQFWLAKLNQFEGNFEQAEMVKAFIDSGEYRQRFGP